MTIDWILFAAIILAQIADIWTTTEALQDPGVREANPLLHRLMGALGVWPALLIAKFLLVACLGVLLAFFSGASLTFALLGILIFYLAITINNINNIRRM